MKLNRISFSKFIFMVKNDLRLDTRFPCVSDFRKMHEIGFNMKEQIFASDRRILLMKLLTVKLNMCAIIELEMTTSHSFIFSIDTLDCHT